MLERLLGFAVADRPNVFDFRTPTSEKRARTPKLRAVVAAKGDRCLIAYAGEWENTRRNLTSCSGAAECVDHLVPLNSNRLRKVLGVKPLPGQKVLTQEIGSAHIDNVIPACAACNGRKQQRIEGALIRSLLAISLAD